MSLFWSVSIYLQRSTPSITTSCSHACRHDVNSGCNPTLTVGPSLSRSVNISQLWLSAFLGPLLFAVYCSPVANVITGHGIQYHQYADDTQLRLALHADNTAAGLAVLAECITDVRTAELQNGIQLNPDKLAAPNIGTSNRLRVRAVFSTVSSVAVAGVDLPITDETYRCVKRPKNNNKR